MKKRVLCYGDSNTWGYVPGVGTRYTKDKRWTGILARLLGDGCAVIEDGIVGRTTVFDDSGDRLRNGKKWLEYALEVYSPLDLVILCLGTNDLKFTDITGSYNGINELLTILDNADSCFPAWGEPPSRRNGTKVLLVSPITMDTNVIEYTHRMIGLYEYVESLKFARYWMEAAAVHQVSFLDAAEYASPSEIDGVHMDEASHLALGEAIAMAARDMLGLG